MARRNKKPAPTWGTLHEYPKREQEAFIERWNESVRKMSEDLDDLEYGLYTWAIDLMNKRDAERLEGAHDRPSEV